jgi:hypothetical protein
MIEPTRKHWLGAAALLLLAGGLALPAADVAPVEMNEAAPEFAGIDPWVNSKPLDWKALRGKVVVVHFWAFG